METVSAYEARVRFGDLLNRVYYGGLPVVVERHGIPLVKITPLNIGKKKKPSKKIKTKKRKETATDKLMKFAGIWSDKEAEVFMKVYKESRSELPKEISPL